MPPFDPAQPASVPPEALRFAAPARLMPPDAEGRRKFSGVAYSGDQIPNHWFWGNVVFDIASTSAPEKVPALVQHDPTKIAGSGSMAFGTDMRIDGLLSAKTPDAKFVADQADEGFPWQMSVFIEPGSIEEVKAGNAVTVNGRQFTGPLTIFRNSRIREVSFCATGADDGTSAKVFSRHAERATQMGTAAASSQNTQPTVETLQAELAALTAQFNAMKTERDAALVEVRDSRKGQIEAMFKARGEEFTDEKAKPFFDMSAAQFSAVVKFTATPPKRDPKLFSADGVDTDAAASGDGSAGKSLVESAKKFGAQAAGAK